MRVTMVTTKPVPATIYSTLIKLCDDAVGISVVPELNHAAIDIALPERAAKGKGTAKVGRQVLQLLPSHVARDVLDCDLMSALRDSAFVASPPNRRRTS